MNLGEIILLRNIRKAIKFIINLPLLCLAAPFVFLIRISKPLFFIRMGRIRNDRIGHFSAEPEFYLCNRETVASSKQFYDLFYYEFFRSCNYQLKKMWSRTLLVSPFIRWVYMLNDMIPGGSKHKINDRNSRDLTGSIDKFSSHISFTKKEEEYGFAELKNKLNISKGEKFICLYLRDSAYLQKKYPGRNWYYHEYRNAKIKNYIQSVEFLEQKGYKVIRMGNEAEERLDLKSENIVDYSFLKNINKDFMDIFLSSKCYFFIGTSGGLIGVPMVFRRPIAFTNSIPLGHAWAWSKNDMFIPKKLWSKSKKRFLAYKEIMESGVGLYLFTQNYDNDGLEVIENTSEEILDLIGEMEGRLAETWETKEEDEILQNRFRTVFNGSNLHGKILSRIGAKFLRNNLELMEGL